MPSELYAVLGLVVVSLGALAASYAAGRRTGRGDLRVAQDEAADVAVELAEERASHAESRKRYRKLLQLAARSAAFRESLAALGLADGSGDFDELDAWLQDHAAQAGAEGVAGVDPAAGQLRADPLVG